MNEEQLFLAQYQQIWNQKRHHDTHIWSIPPIVAAIAAFVFSQIRDFQFNIWTKCIIFLLMLVFLVWGVTRLVLRHVFFETAYSCLLRQMDFQKKPLPYIPQSQDDQELLKSFRSQLDIFARWGANCRWGETRFLLLLTLFLFLLILGDMTNAREAFRTLLKIDIGP